jgi:hypothetical protein
VNSAPARNWVPYGGYVPRRDKPEAPAPAAATSGSPVLKSESKTEIKAVTPAARKWEPYGGYDPRKDAAVSSASTFLKSESETEMKTVSPCDLKLAFFQSHGRPGSAAADQNSSAQMTSAPARKWEPYAGYDPRSRPAAPSPAAAAEQSSSAPVTSAAATKWEPYGYDPRKGSSQLEHSSAAPITGYLERLEQRLMGEVENMRKSPEMTTAPAKKWQPYRGYEPTRHKGDAAVSKNSGAAEQSSSPQMTSAAANKWQPYRGYDPRSRAAAAPSPAAASSGAPANKWEPYGGGYVPKRDSPPPPASAASPSYFAPASYAAPSSPLKTTDTLSSAPAKKWQPYAGYEPKRDRPPTPAPAASSTPFSAPASFPAPSAPLKTGTLSSAPAKKWQPYAGYEPKRDRTPTPAPAASSTPFSAPVSASYTPRYAVHRLLPSTQYQSQTLTYADCSMPTYADVRYADIC